MPSEGGSGSAVAYDPNQQPAISALTVHQPWAWAICNAGRRLENRDWRPPPYIAGQIIALHAGKRWGRSEKIEASALACQLHPEHEVPLGAEGYRFGAVVAVARVVGFVDRDVKPDRGPYTFDTSTSKGHVCVGGRFTQEQVESVVQNEWFKGPCAWMLSDVQVLADPVEVRGYQKLWRLPGPEALKVATQVNLG